MIMFILGIIGLLFIIGVISLLADFENSLLSCLFGIIGIFSIYAIVAGAMDFMFWLGYIIGPPYAIVVTILLILSPFILWFLYGKLKSKGITDLLSNKIKENKKIVSIILLVVILIIIVAVITYIPMSSEQYTVECPKDYQISKDEVGFPPFDNEFKGFLHFKNYTAEIKVWHHNAHGNSLKYFLNQMDNYDSIDINKVKKISIDGEPAYKIKCHWRYGIFDVEEFVIFVHNDEYYLIHFHNVPKEIENAFLDSFKFK